MEEKKRKHVTALIILAVILLVMGISFATTAKNPSSASDGILGFVINPVRSLISTVSDSVGGFFGFMFDMKDLQQENLELQTQVDTLSAKVRELESYQQENDRLRKLLDFKDGHQEYDTVGCQVIAKEPGNWFYAFTVDKGTKDNISVGDVVVSGQGLVGKITEVSQNQAKVLSIIDTESSVGAMVARTQNYAIVDGELSLSDQGKCKLNFVTQGSSLVLGDVVVTSGLGGVYPRGLLIGTVVDVKSDSMGYSQYAIIDTEVDFERVREVMVIRMHGEG